MISTFRIVMILCFAFFLTSSVLFSDEPKTLNGHKDWVTAIAFAPNGRLLASGSRDGTIKLWDVKMGTVVATLTGHEAGITCLAFAGKRLASGSADKTIQIWDVASRDSLKS